MRSAANAALALAAEYGLTWRDRVRPIHPEGDAGSLRQAFGGPTPETGMPQDAVIAELIQAAEPGLVGNTQPGFHAWVMGGSSPVGVAADWLTSVWGQNAAIFQCSPAAATAEEAAATWLLDILGLPRDASVGFVTGATMAGFTCLAAARDEILRRAGHDFARDGLAGSPAIRVLISEDTHVSNLAALRYLGFGSAQITKLPGDSQGRIDLATLAQTLYTDDAPTIVIATAGHINSGAFDYIGAISEMTVPRGAWLHVDAAFGLWARAVPELSFRTAGLERADSWSTDAHKWLQVPYDSGVAIVRHAEAHRRAMDVTAGYLSNAPEDGRNPTQYGPELSRRARGFAVWAVLKVLGREGVADLVRRHCNGAQRLANRLSGIDGIHVLNRVTLNQIALRFEDARGDADALTAAVEAGLNDAEHFVRTAEWRGQRILRLSVIEDGTDDAALDRLAMKIERVWAETKQALKRHPD
ncbi:MAG: aminotransferase class V-fold PLP-dependent enzyme [Rhodobacteraceae bacterium]|nr:aminotransferase class V-fold PLP-dependent enzyme [Paracoccaceae bacterium]